MFVYVGLFLIASSFAVIVFYLVRLLNSITGTMKSLDLSVEQLSEQIEEVSEESKHLILQTSKTVDEVQHKVNSTSGLIGTIQNIGGILNSVNHTIGRSVDHFSSHANEQKKRMMQIAKWGNAAYQMYERKSKTK